MLFFRRDPASSAPRSAFLPTEGAIDATCFEKQGTPRRSITVAAGCQDDPFSTGFGSRRAHCKSLAVPGILVVDDRLMKQILFFPVIHECKALGLHRFVFFSGFVQNHRQARPDSPKALPDQPDRPDIERFNNLEKLRFRFFRNRNFDHFLFL
jgi:hypothetical protein